MIWSSLVQLDLRSIMVYWGCSVVFRIKSIIYSLIVHLNAGAHNLQTISFILFMVVIPFNLLFMANVRRCIISIAVVTQICVHW